MRSLGYGKDYRYDHGEPGAHATGQQYFPDGMGEPIYYEPTARGLEIRIAERLAELRKTRSGR
jgi:putative ATPase